MRWIGAIFGALLLVLGTVTTNVALQVNAAFDADPVCTTSLTFETPARSGPICVIYHGSISRTFTTIGSKGVRQHHIVVVSDSGRELEVEPEMEFRSPVFSRATPGSRAVVETVKGSPAFIATSNGSLSGVGNPRTTLVATAVTALAGALMIFFAARRRRRLAPRRPSYRT